MLSERAFYCLQFPCNIQSRRNAGQQYNERHHNFAHLNKEACDILCNSPEMMERHIAIVQKCEQCTDQTRNRYLNVAHQHAHYRDHDISDHKCDHNSSAFAFSDIQGAFAFLRMREAFDRKTIERSGKYEAICKNRPAIQRHFAPKTDDQEEIADALVSALMDFENNAWHRPVLEILPKLSGNYNMTVAELGRQIENFLEEENASRLENSIFSLHRREMACSGRKATEAFVRGDRKLLPLSRLKGKTALECAMIYPPGICAVTAGEKWTQNDISYFLFIEKYMNRYPDFAPEIIGLHKKETTKGEKLFAWILFEGTQRV